MIIKERYYMTEKQTHFHFGVYGLIQNESQTHILLIKKLVGAYQGMLDLPGGTMDFGETVEETFKREVFEETACTVESCHQLQTLSTVFDFERDGKPQALHHIGTIYQATVIGEPSDIGDGVDSGGCVWVAKNKLASHNVVPFVEEILSYL